MAKCPRCRAEVDPEFYTHCPDCGASLHADVAELHDPEPSPSAPTLPPPPPATPAPKNKSKWISLGIRLALVVVLFSGGIIRFFTSAKRDDSGEITKPGTIEFSDMRVGDCANYPDIPTDADGTFEFTDLKAQRCSDPHDFEMYAILSFPAGSNDPFPGRDAIIEWALNECYDRFEPYTGVAYEESLDLDIDGFLPSEDSWEQGDRHIQCLLIGYNPVDPTDIPQLVGSKKASAD